MQQSKYHKAVSPPSHTMCELWICAHRTNNADCYNKCYHDKNNLHKKIPELENSEVPWTGNLERMLTAAPAKETHFLSSMTKEAFCCCLTLITHPPWLHGLGQMWHLSKDPHPPHTIVQNSAKTQASVDPGLARSGCSPESMMDFAQSESHSSSKMSKICFTHWGITSSSVPWSLLSSQPKIFFHWLHPPSPLSSFFSEIASFCCAMSASHWENMHDAMPDVLTSTLRPLS